MENKTFLEFIEFGVSKMNLERQSTSKLYEFEINFGRGIGEVSGSPDEFLCIFGFNLKSKDDTKKFELTMECFGRFKVGGQPDDRLINIYKTINAPAIVYPYIRAFLSNFAMGIGINPITIPPVNFIALAQEEKKDSDGLTKDI